MRRQRPRRGRDADLGIAAGNKRGHLFVKGQNVAVVPEDEMVDALVEWAEFIMEHGVEAALARVDIVKAAREAEKDRARLLDEQGDDANHADEKIVEIRKTARADRPRPVGEQPPAAANVAWTPAVRDVKAADAAAVRAGIRSVGVTTKVGRWR